MGGYMGAYNAFWWAGINTCAVFDIGVSRSKDVKRDMRVMTAFRENYGLGQNVEARRKELCELLCRLLQADLWSDVDVDTMWKPLPMFPSEDLRRLINSAYSPQVKFFVTEIAIHPDLQDFLTGSGESSLTQAILKSESAKVNVLKRLKAKKRRRSPDNDTPAKEEPPRKKRWRKSS